MTYLINKYRKIEKIDFLTGNLKAKFCVSSANTIKCVSQTVYPNNPIYLLLNTIQTVTFTFTFFLNQIFLLFAGKYIYINQYIYHFIARRRNIEILKLLGFRYFAEATGTLTAGSFKTVPKLFSCTVDPF